MPTRSKSNALPEFLILGLGNPGEEYRGTRHNLGFRVVDALAAAYHGRWSKAPGPAVAVPVVISARSGVLAKPMTWMNRSGIAARGIAESLGGPAVAGILVVADELDLPLGRLRLRAGGGHGGHNGLRSVIAELGTNEFPRLKLGIGRPSGDVAEDVVDHVLEAFLPEEREAADRLVERACACVETFVAEGITAAMSRFNA
jgi:PTH1 family peptidyl-tRNA hydrolase